MTLSAVLLVGGESRRMGRDKATLEFGGRPLWKRQLEVLHGLSPETVFVSARTTPPWLPNDTKLLLDEPPSRGPISGLAKALAAIGTTHLMVLAVDMPFMTPSEFGSLLERATERRGVVPIIGDRAEPLAAIYPVTAAADFQRALAGPDYSLQVVVRTLAATDKIELCSVAPENVHCYGNVNEADDFNAFPEFGA